MTPVQLKMLRYMASKPGGAWPQSKAVETRTLDALVRGGYVRLIHPHGVEITEKGYAELGRENPDSILSQIVVNTTQDIVLAVIGCAVVGGVAYLIYKKSTDAGATVGQGIANFASSTSSSLFPGAGQRVESSTTPYGETAEQGAAGSVAAGAAGAEGYVPDS